MRPIHRSPGANPPPKRVQVLALRDCTALVPIGLFDLLRKSIELAASMGAGPPPVEVRLVAAGDDPVVRGAGGVELRCQATARRLGPGDLVVVPAVDPDVFEQLEKNRA